MVIYYHWFSEQKYFVIFLWICIDFLNKIFLRKMFRNKLLFGKSMPKNQNKSRKSFFGSTLDPTTMYNLCLHCASDRCAPNPPLSAGIEPNSNCVADTLPVAPRARRSFLRLLPGVPPHSCGVIRSSSCPPHLSPLHRGAHHRRYLVFNPDVRGFC